MNIPPAEDRLSYSQAVAALRAQGYPCDKWSLVALKIKGAFSPEFQGLVSRSVLSYDDVERLKGLLTHA